MTIKIQHTADADCDVGPDQTCSGCGATHAAPCPSCGAAAYHRPGCAFALEEPAPLVIIGDQVDPIAELQRAELAAAGLHLTAAGDLVEIVRVRGAYHDLAPQRIAGATEPDWQQVGDLVAAADACGRSAADYRAAADRLAARRTFAAELLEVATAHGFGHPDTGPRCKVSIGSSSTGSTVVLQLYGRPRRDGAGRWSHRAMSARVHELAAAVLRGTDGDWPVQIIPFADDGAAESEIGAVLVELDDRGSCAAALEQLRAMPELGSRPW